MTNSSEADEIGKTNDAEEKQAFRPGIYLEEKTGSIGTGGTAKTAAYRSFWATLSISEHSAVMVLLNDDFRPTSIREIYPLETLRGPKWHYIAEGQKRYARLRPHLDRMAAQPDPAAARAPAEKPGSGNWWAGGGSAGASKKKEPPKRKNNWWDS